MDLRDIASPKSEPLSLHISLKLGEHILTAVTVISPELKEFIKHNYDFDDKVIGIWPSGVNLEFFSDSHLLEQGPVDKNPGDLVLMHHGSYRADRGLMNLIKSISNQNDLPKQNINGQKPTIAFICDVKGWAWWLKSNYLKNYLKVNFCPPKILSI